MQNLTGSKLVDNSRIYHSDANYNFDLIEFAEIQVGGSLENTKLLKVEFTDKDGLGINYIVNMELILK
jgi:hypothetical protein